MTLRTPAFNDAKSYGFEWLRAMLEVGRQEGVIGAGDLKVTAAAAGGQRVDIAAGIALIKGDSGTPGTGLSQGLFLEVNDGAVANAVTLNASDVTNPRVDQILLRVRDSSDLGSGADDAVFEVLTGVATAGATLDNRNGAAALPNDRVRLADVLVPAGSSAVTAGNVRDRRPWATGAYRRAPGSGAASYTTTSLTQAAIDSANLATRVELSGAPVRVWLRAKVTIASNANRTIFMFNDNGAAVNTGQFTSADWAGMSNTGTISGVIPLFDWPAPPAGSHLIVPTWAVSAAVTATMTNAAADRPELVVEEILRPNADNT